MYDKTLYNNIMSITRCLQKVTVICNYVPTRLHTYYYELQQLHKVYLCVLSVMQYYYCLSQFCLCACAYV